MENLLQSDTLHRRNPTIHDVAAALGMHKSTVSLGLSGKGNVSQKTRARIEVVAREMGYLPNPLAQRLATNAGNNQVMLCARTLDVGITTEKLLLIQNELARRGFETPIYSLSGDGMGHEENQATQIRQLCRQQPRAIVCSAHAIHESAFPELARYQSEGGIVVSYDVAVPLDCDQIVFDREHNAYQAARYLIQAGHRELGLALASPRNEMDGDLFFVQNARLRGFKRAMDEVGLQVRREWIFEEESSYETGGALLATQFLALKERPTGLCIVNDYMALAFMARIQRAGVLIPNDLSVIGHDNQPIAAFCPIPLTCATQPGDRIAEAVVERLTERLSNWQEAPQTIVIRGEIVERESVAALK